MHRHRYRGRKLHRDSAQRKALLRGLAIGLIENGSIETTLVRAKEVRPFVEKLVTKARTDNLHNRRQIISALNDDFTAHILVDEIAPKLKRDSGYLRIERTTLRRGDLTQMARISFVDDITQKSTKPEKKTTVDKVEAPKKAKAGAKK